MGRVWRLPRLHCQEIEDLARGLRLPPFIVRFLYHRGFRDRDSIIAHLTPTLASLNDPFTMKDMERAVERLVQAVQGREPVAIFGDYDVDGVCGAALLHLALRELGLHTRVYIPHRVKEGYGLNKEAIHRLHNDGVRLILTVDCGVCDREEVELAASLGMDVIITDHHEPPAELPRAVAVVDPKRRDCPYPFKGLAGVGVAFNLVRAVRNRLFSTIGQEDSAPNLKKYLDLVALGTIADMVPLLSDNRILVRAGLNVLASTPRVGLRALKEVAGISSAGPITTTDVGFRLGPRINAAGRMAHAEEAFRLMVTEDPVQAQDIAARLHGLNSSRQTLEASTLKEARAMVEAMGDRPAYVLWSADWSQGVVGIVASKLVEAYGKPVILLADMGTVAKGSGRAPEPFDLYRALTSCSDLLMGFGGHRAAAGVTVSSQAKEEFRARFEQAVEEQLSCPSERPSWLVTDGRMGVEAFCDSGLTSLLSLLEPYGVDYPEPLVAVNRFSVVRRKAVGGGRHMRLILAPTSGPANGTVALMGWRHGDKVNLPWERMELICSPYINTYQGVSRVNLELRDAREAERLHAAP